MEKRKTISQTGKKPNEDCSKLALNRRRLLRTCKRIICSNAPLEEQVNKLESSFVKKNLETCGLLDFGELVLHILLTKVSL